VSQCADALQVLLERKVEGLMTRRQMKYLADRLVADIDLTQARNRRARESHRRRRLRELRQRGIKCSTLTCCDEKVAL
jgi:hypothetical protein